MTYKKCKKKKKGPQWQHVSYKSGVGCHYGPDASKCESLGAEVTRLFLVCAENERPGYIKRKHRGWKNRMHMEEHGCLQSDCCIKTRSNSCEMIKAIPFIYVNYQPSIKT